MKRGKGGKGSEWIEDDLIEVSGGAGGGVSVAASDIYGLEHLVRLVVALPSMMGPVSTTSPVFSSLSVKLSTFSWYRTFDVWKQRLSYSGRCEVLDIVSSIPISEYRIIKNSVYGIGCCCCGCCSQNISWPQHKAVRGRRTGSSNSRWSGRKPREKNKRHYAKNNNTHDNWRTSTPQTKKKQK